MVYEIDSINQQANEYNTQMLAELPGEEFTCEAIIDKRDNRTNFEPTDPKTFDKVT